MALQSHVPSPKTWAICDVVVKILSPIVTIYVLNQSCIHWLLGDALQFIITKACEFRDDVVNLVVLDSMGHLEANVFDAKVTKFTIHMKHQTLEVLWPFLSFFNGFDKKRGYNMFALMLNLRFKNMWLVANYLRREFTSSLVAKYDVCLLLLLLMQCYNKGCPFVVAKEV